ncbi:Target of rapamycin complex 2 subunit avo2 [Stygiomarasmius scandens]|uniref:Target of rapamycin complex 2 subunit avo2 n=1 Tax=Marasmiellus scandens TaxID=2682957 RepID=A0ABR1K4I0_9AGAR
MAEKDTAARLRRAVKENNLFLVKRLVQRTDQRNPDPSYRRYTSLAWAAVLGNEETFEFLLVNGHDDHECSKDSENNTVLMLLADQKTSVTSPYSSSLDDSKGAALRMARLYFDRYPNTLDWPNSHGKTPLHVSAQKGSEELVRMLLDLGADYDLTDNEGNTPLHYASAWGHIPVVQLLIERGCQYSAPNDEGFTASDYAYSFSTRDTLQDTARLQYENNKKMRRAIFAQAASRGSELNSIPPMPVHSHSGSRSRDLRSPAPRLRSGSGTSRTTATSDSGDYEANGLAAPHSQSSLSTSSSPSQSSSTMMHLHPSYNHSTTPSFPGALNPPANPSSALSQLASRVRERDADAMEKYMRRNRSESASTDNRSVNGSGHSANADSVSSLGVFHSSGTSTPKRLRPSISASQLRPAPSPEVVEGRARTGTTPTSTRPHHAVLTRSSSISNSNSPRSLTNPHPSVFEEPESYTGPPSQYAQFPEPPAPARAEESTSTPAVVRRMGGALHTLAKPSLDALAVSHRRGMSAASFRGTT